MQKGPRFVLARCIIMVANLLCVLISQVFILYALVDAVKDDTEAPRCSTPGKKVTLELLFFHVLRNVDVLTGGITRDPSTASATMSVNI